ILEQSSELTTSYPNCNFPFSVSVSLMTCTRCPAGTKSQSSVSAVGTKARKSSICSSLDMASCSIKYLVSDKFFAPDKTMVNALLGFSELIKFMFDPFRSEDHTSEL